MQIAMRVTVALLMLLGSSAAVMAAQRTVIIEMFTNNG